MISRAGALVVSTPMELFGTWIWSQCCSYAVVQISLETVALEVDVLGSRREQGEEHVGRGRSAERVWKWCRSFAQCSWGPVELAGLQGWLGLGLPCKRRGGGLVGSWRRGKKSFSLSLDLSQSGSVAWEGSSRSEGCCVECWGTRMAHCWLSDDAAPQGLHVA